VDTAEKTQADESYPELIDRVARWRNEKLKRIWEVITTIAAVVGIASAIAFYFLIRTGLSGQLLGCLVVGFFIYMSVALGGYMISSLAIRLYFPPDIVHLPPGVENAYIQERLREIRSEEYVPGGNGGDSWGGGDGGGENNLFWVTMTF